MHQAPTGRIEGRLANVCGALLLGGDSQRMGQDKAEIEWQGDPLATRVARLLDTFFEETLLVGGSAPPGAPGRIVRDEDDAACRAAPHCALRGLVAALAAAQTERIVVLATDMPLVTPELLLALTAWPEADAVVPRTADGAHPLCAIYRRDSVLEIARANLSRGRLALRELLGAIDTEYLEGDDLAAVAPGGRALLNVNDAEELERARRLADQEPEESLAKACKRP